MVLDPLYIRYQSLDITNPINAQTAYDYYVNLTGWTGSLNHIIGK